MTEDQKGRAPGVEGRQEGKEREATLGERYLATLCRKSFLTFWSYPQLYTSQGLNERGEGRELADLVVVFDDNVLIFSDKDCAFPRSGNLQVDWCRWFKRAIWKSAAQIHGAERWLRSYPDRVFVDRRCTKPFPLSIPHPDQARYHRIVVAHSISPLVAEHFGESGSLVLIPAIQGTAHFHDPAKAMPFVVGDLDPAKGYVHVFDDYSLDVVMRSENTITDFVQYLEKKERLVRSNRLLSANGEEELLAIYRKYMNAQDEHDFAVPGSEGASLVVQSGTWDDFQRSPEHRAQVEADRISYAWDQVIEKFTYHTLTGTQDFTNSGSIADDEVALRLMAREPRVRRRMLARGLIDAVELTGRGQRRTRVILPSAEGDPHYVFLVLGERDGVALADYRHARREFLYACCMVVKHVRKEAQRVVGIAAEGRNSQARSEDLLVLDCSEWSDAQDEEARELREKLNLFTNVTMQEFRESEYPDKNRGGEAFRGPISRNGPCPCGSGKRYKYCHGRKRRL